MPRVLVEVCPRSTRRNHQPRDGYHQPSIRLEDMIPGMRSWVLHWDLRLVCHKAVHRVGGVGEGEVDSTPVPSYGVISEGLDGKP